jgi:hypothetical protein
LKGLATVYKLKKILSEAENFIENPARGLLALGVMSIVTNLDRLFFHDVAICFLLFYVISLYKEVKKLEMELRERDKKMKRLTLDEIAYNRINTKKAH